MNESIRRSRNRRIWVSPILEYPLSDSPIRFEVWRDETIPGHGVHVWENLGNCSLGAVHFKHAEVWIREVYDQVPSKS